MNIMRVPLTQWNSTLALTGFPTWGEYGQLGREILDHVAGRRYKFVKIDLSGVSAYEGVPVVYVSTAKVTPDVSDAIVAVKQGGFSFAGILATSTTISPTSGSTAYGWILCEGPLGKIAGSMQQDRTLKTYLSSKGGSAGKCFYVSSGATDLRFRKMSTAAVSTMINQVVANLHYFGSTLGASTRQSVTKGYVRSIWR